MGTAVVIGGGAAGFFAAIACAEAHPGAWVLIYEKSRQLLGKVKVSGGGRCNVTHSCFDADELVRNYPRGSRELKSVFRRWQPSDTIEWFESRGVKLKTERDGRIFPVSDRSSTIIECLRDAADIAGVRVHTGEGIVDIDATDGLFTLRTSGGNEIKAERVLIASGGGKKSAGHVLAKKFGHSIITPVPSLFTFHINDSLIEGLQGIAVADATVSSAGFKHEGPILITHWGLSGPAILKLSAWGAREFAEAEYNFQIQVNWLGRLSASDTSRTFENKRKEQGAKRVYSNCPYDLPKRLWYRLLDDSGIDESITWANLSKKQQEWLMNSLISSRFNVSGKSMNKEEFVTCGGVSLKEINFKNMESRIVPGLHFAGEVTDIDGVTGGFNFQAAWSTGHIAGNGMTL